VAILLAWTIGYNLFISKTVSLTEVYAVVSSNRFARSMARLVYLLPSVRDTKRLIYLIPSVLDTIGKCEVVSSSNNSSNSDHGSVKKSETRK